MAAKETEKMTIEQVADALGLSKTTVSRALSGKGRISEATRTKVYAYMGRTRSEPVSAQSGEKLRTNNIAMVVPQRFIALDLPFLRKCMGGICTMADQRGYDLMLCYASNTEYSQLQRQLANHKVDGVILTYAMADDPCIELLRQYETPFVLIGRSEDKTIPQADNDQVAAACEMTRILLQLGAKRIALLVGSTIYAVNTDRIRGYLRGFAEFGVPVDQRLVHSGVESAGQTLDALEAALEQKADCILCGDDEIAFEVMRELRTRHILVPNDLRVAYSFYAGAGLVATLADDGINTVCNWNEAPGADVTQAILDIAANPGFKSGADADIVSAIKDGSCCAAISGTWNANTAEEAWGEGYAATKLPTYTLNGEQVQMGSFSGYKLVGVNPHSTNVGVAMMLADFITNEDNQIKRFNDRKLGPSNINANATEAVQSAPAIAALAEQSSYATLQRVGANYWSSAASLGEILASGDTQGKTTQQLMDDAVAGITAPVAQ